MGGGRDVLSALVFDQNSVTGVEVNRDVLRATTEVFGDFAGHIERNPKVTLAVDEARSYLTRLDRKFDLVQLSLIDTWAATAAGAFVLTENSLYTVGGVDDLPPAPDAPRLLTVSRWYYPPRPGEAIRIAALARAALIAIGVSNPGATSSWSRRRRRPAARARFGNGIATILVCSRAVLGRGPRDARRRRWRAWASTTSRRPMARREPAYRHDPRSWSTQFYRIVPRSTSRRPRTTGPFFFQMLRLRDVMKSLSTSTGSIRTARISRPFGSSPCSLVVITVLTAACI